MHSLHFSIALHRFCLAVLSFTMKQLLAEVYADGP